MEVSTTLASLSQGQPEILLDTSEQTGEIDVGLSQSIVLTDHIVVINNDTNAVFIRVVRLESEDFVPNWVKRFADNTGLVDLVTPVILITDLNRAVWVRITAQIGGRNICGLNNTELKMELSHGFE